MSTTFKLKCVGCQMVEERPADECHEQPMCNKCYMPMTLQSVIHHAGKKPKGPRTVVKKVSA